MGEGAPRIDREREPTRGLHVGLFAEAESGQTERSDHCCWIPMYLASSPSSREMSRPPMCSA